MFWVQHLFGEKQSAEENGEQKKERRISVWGRVD